MIAFSLTPGFINDPSQALIFTHVAIIALSALTGSLLASLFSGVRLSPHLFLFAAFAPAILAAILLVPPRMAPSNLSWTALLVSALVCLALIDAKTRTVPDMISVPMILLGIAHAMVMNEPYLVFTVSAVGLIVLSAAIHFILKGGTDWIGGGDVLLLSGSVAWFGPAMIPDILVLTTAILGLQLLVSRVHLPNPDICLPHHTQVQRYVPLAPALGAAQLAIWFGGPLF